MSMKRKCIDSKRLITEDINKPCIELANYLLGKILVRKLEDNTILKGRIVETESYLAGDDKGSRTYNNRRTEATEPLFMSAGTCFVYMTYGMYHCINISSKEPGAAVLLRALEPLQGIDLMTRFRSKKLKSDKAIKQFELCNGPSKLCIAMDITKDNSNIIDVTNLKNNVLWIEDDPDFDSKHLKIVNCARIGIARAEEWATKPLRYYILNNENVSKRDKQAEKMFEADD